jgi:hypothetical protein
VSAAPTSAPIPSPSQAASPASPTADVAGTATAQAPANATTTAQTEGTAVARAVDATVTVAVQALATAATLSAQQTATAPTPTSATASSATPAVPTPSPVTAPPSPTTSVASACPAQTVRGFGLIYTTNAAVASRLGCALEGEAGTSSATQPFENGLLIAFGVTKQIFVLKNSGATWVAYPDDYQSGQPLPTATVVAPTGRFAPSGGFGLAWERQPDVRAQLGWAMAPEQDFTTGALQIFAHGRMFWTADKMIYVLYSDNTWQKFPDTFQG